MKNSHYKPDITPNAFRIAPSPTGYVHLGTVGMALVNSYLARQTHGTFYLRIEDTDTKRYVPDAVAKMLTTFQYFGFQFDAMYTQSERRAIYQQYADQLIREGKAYRCFCSETELTAIRTAQQAQNIKTGYYGPYARCKHLSPAAIQERLDRGDPYVIRANFSYQDWGERITFTDLAKGTISLPPQTNDPVIIKSNGLPTYNFAHVVDDTLLHTAVVVRGEEWLISTAEHLQLCDLLGFPRLTYLHMPTINIEDHGKKRKLSKRKDPMALVMNLIDDPTTGYPKEAILEYLLTIYNTDFETWRLANPQAPLTDFQFKIEKIGSNNPLFDLPKLNDIAKNVLARQTQAEIVAAFRAWGPQKIPGLTPVVQARVEAMFNVERGTARPRKDLAKFGDIPTLYRYLFDNLVIDATGLDHAICAKYADLYDAADDKDTWWAKVQSLGADKKAVRQIAHDLRVAITGQENTPDLWAICQILGNDLVKTRLRQASKS